MTAAETSHSPRAFDLCDLVRRLREAGFRADTRQYLTAHQLILALARQGTRLDQIADFRDVEKLAARLAPVFCHSPEEQGRFKDIVAQWLDMVKPEPPLRRISALKDHREKLKTVTTRPVRVFVGMALLVMAGTILFYYFVPVTLTGQIRRIEPDDQKAVAAGDANVTLDDDKIALDESGRFSFELTRFASPARILVKLKEYQDEERSIDARLNAPIEIVLQPVQPPPRPPDRVNGIRIGEPLVIAPKVLNSTIVRKTDWPMAGGIAATAGIGVFLVLLMADQLRRKLVLKRLPVPQRPDVTSLAVTGAPATVLSGPQLRRLVGALRRPRKEEVFELSALLTARATARAAGMFSPVWEPRKRMPEYVVLIHRKSAQDHQALMYDDFLKRLEQSDVAITRYYFKDDPRVCRRADDSLSHWLLSELTVIHHACRLLICADADLLFDPLTGVPAPWTARFKQWSHRVLFTSQPPCHWTSREWALTAEGMIVLPATVKGIQLFAELPDQWRIESLFPAPYARAFPSLVGSQGLRWLDRSAPPDDIIEKLMRQLRGFLGPSGFAWMCACAVYPEIIWSLTRYLAGAVFDASPAGTAPGFSDSLSALARLPWFRFGYMPDWLRSVLISQLSVEQERTVRRHLGDLLDKMARQSPKAAGAHGLKVATWITARDLMTTSPSDHSLADTVFIGFMSGARMDRLAVQAPSAFKGLFRGLRRLPRPNIPSAPRSFGYRLAAWFKGVVTWHKSLLRTSVSALTGLLVLALTVPLFTIVQEQPIDTIVHDIAFNPEGTRLASGSWDNAIGLWDPVSGNRIGLFKGHSNYVTRIFFSPDGKTLASGSWDKTARLWDVATGRELVVLRGHSGAVYSVTFSPDGRMLATGSADKTVRLWNASSFEQTAVLNGHGDFVSSVAISPDGRTLASGSGDRTIRLWDIYTGRPVKVLEGHTAYVSAVAFSPDGRTLASGSGDKTVRLWDLHTGQQIYASEGHEDYVSTVVFSPDAKFIASSGSNDKSIRLWDAATGKLVRALHDFAQMPVLCVAFNPQETALAAGEWGKIFVWPMDIQAQAKEVAVPYVLAMSLEAARQTLEKAGLNLGPTKSGAGRGWPGTVAAQQPTAGVRVPRGTQVALTLIAATSQVQVSVPSLIGLGPAQAKKILLEAGLNLGGTAYGRDKKIEANRVIDQQPPAKTKVEKGSTVSITVNQIESPANTLVPPRSITIETVK